MTIIIFNKKNNIVVFQKEIKDLDSITTYPESVQIELSFEGVEASFAIDLKENKFIIK